jgi:adenylyltransferase/sulfurtransferase
MEAVNAKPGPLRNEILTAEAQLRNPKEEAQVEASATAQDLQGLSFAEQSCKEWPLSGEEYQRYGRQMIVPDIGIQGLFRSLL